MQCRAMAVRRRLRYNGRRPCSGRSGRRCTAAAISGEAPTKAHGAKLHRVDADGRRIDSRHAMRLCSGACRPCSGCSGRSGRQWRQGAQGQTPLRWQRRVPHRQPRCHAARTPYQTAEQLPYHGRKTPYLTLPWKIDLTVTSIQVH